jgi:hypothetical protein
MATEKITPPRAMAPRNKDEDTGATTRPPVENSTDATQGQALGVRALARKAELEALLPTLEPHQAAMRADIERALASVATLLRGDSAHLSAATAAELNRWLEAAKFFAEPATTEPAPAPVL